MPRNSSKGKLGWLLARDAAIDSWLEGEIGWEVMRYCLTLYAVNGNASHPEVVQVRERGIVELARWAA